MAASATKTAIRPLAGWVVGDGDSVLMLRVVGVTVPGGGEEGQPHAVATRDLLARLAVRVAHVGLPGSSGTRRGR